MRAPNLIPIFRSHLSGNSPVVALRVPHPYYNTLLNRSSRNLISEHTTASPFGTIRTYATTQPQGEEKSKAVAPSSQSSGAVSVSVGEKVKENVKTSIYGGVILVGIAVAGGMGYVLLRELFSSESPQNIYSASFKLCQANTEVQDALGTPLKCFGEENSRGRRRHIAHQELLQPNGAKILRMKYYIQGKFRSGTVNLEKRTQTPGGKYEYSYLIVDVDGYPPKRIDVRNAILD